VRSRLARSRRDSACWISASEAVAPARQDRKLVVQLLHRLAGIEGLAFLFVEARGRGRSLLLQRPYALQVAFGERQSVALDAEQVLEICPVGIELVAFGLQRRDLGLGLGDGKFVVGRIDGNQAGSGGDDAGVGEIRSAVDHRPGHPADCLPRYPGLGNAIALGDRPNLHRRHLHDARRLHGLVPGNTFGRLADTAKPPRETGTGRQAGRHQEQPQMPRRSHAHFTNGPFHRSDS
jgi:hypothetical protein